VRRMGHARPPGLNRQKAATLTATLRDNPVEHGNIRVIESGGQARHRATGLRYHDLECAITAEMLSMMGGVTAEDPPQFSDPIGLADRSTCCSSLRRRRPRPGASSGRQYMDNR
jgi:hypothetical protein